LPAQGKETYEHYLSITVTQC